MTNSRILTQAFEYMAPKNIEELMGLLKQHGSKARIMAGGTDLVVMMKQEKVQPAFLIHIMGIPELCHIREEGGLRIGAASKLRDVRAFCADSPYQALHEAISVLGKPQVWNMGTIGGNLCTASPAADTAPPLLVLNARVRLLGPKGERVVPLEDFFTGVNQTVLSPQEILLSVQTDPMEPGTGNAFMKIARVGADVSKITCAVFLKREGNVCKSCRIALGAVAPVPMRVKEAEALLQDQEMTNAFIERAGGKVSEEIRPIDDVRSTAEYRRHVAGVLFRDVFWKAWHRAGGEEN